MKTRNLVSIFAVIALIFTFVACKQQYAQHEMSVDNNAVIVVDQSEEIVGTYGAEISVDDAIPASMVITSLGDKDSTDLTVEGTIQEVCQMKGCWMTMDIGNGKTMRVTFKDYGFFVPKKASGYVAIMQGEAKKEWVDVKTLKHYAEDEGKSEDEIAAITDGEEALTFEAVGVVIKKAVKG